MSESKLTKLSPGWDGCVTIVNETGRSVAHVFHSGEWNANDLARKFAAAPDLLDLLSEARQAIDWYLGLCNSFEAGETYRNHPDPNAYSYLKMEAWNIGERIDMVIAAANGVQS